MHRNVMVADVSDMIVVVDLVVELVADLAAKQVVEDALDMTVEVVDTEDKKVADLDILTIVFVMNIQHMYPRTRLLCT